MAEDKFHPDVERRIGEHLEAIDKALAAKAVPFSERRSITGDVEAQIRDMLAARGGAPAVADVEAVLARLDAPESYAEAVEPASAVPPFQVAPEGPSSYSRTKTTGLRFCGKVLFVIAIGWFIWPFIALVMDPDEPKLLTIFLYSFATALAFYFLSQLVDLLARAGQKNKDDLPKSYTEEEAHKTHLTPRQIRHYSRLGILCGCLFVFGLALVELGGVACTFRGLFPAGIAEIGVGLMLIVGAFKPVLAKRLAIAAVILAVIMVAAASIWKASSKHISPASAPASTPLSPPHGTGSR